MNTVLKNRYGLLVGLALAVNWPLYADVPPTLSLGETINVTNTSDVSPTTPSSCTGTGPFSCSSLREAVALANGNGNGATHYDVINLGAGTHTLTLAGTNEDAASDGDLDITEAVSIVGAGAGATIIDGGGSGGTLQERIFTVHGVAVEMEGLTLTNGFAKYELGGAIFNDEKSNLSLTNCEVTNSTATWDGDYTTDSNADGQSGTVDNPEGTVETQGSGGAIYSKDVMNIENCVFRGNVASTVHPDGVKVGNGGAINASQYTVINNSTFGSNVAIDSDSNVAINGGALFMTGGNPLVITNSTFSYNSAVSGGGINNVSPSAPTEITNSTISGNFVTDSGAGIESNAAMTLLNVTIVNNMKESNNKGAGLNTGPGVSITAKNVLFDNNLHDANTSYTESSNCGAKGAGSDPESPIQINSQGGNVSSDETCNLNVSLTVPDQENATVNLVALADNGGATWTHALPRPDIASSAAVDTANNIGCPNNDQRGSIRPFNATLLFSAICDAGAYELYVERTDLHIENMTAPSKVIQGEDVTIDIVVDNGDAVASDVVLTTNIPAELSYVSATPSAGACSVDGVSVVCDFGSIASGAEASVSIVATADVLKDGVVVGTYASTATLDPDLTNNLASVTFNIVEVTDMAVITASTEYERLYVGRNTDISVTIKNLGPNDASGVKVTGVLPSMLSFVQGIGCAEDAPGFVTCEVGGVANGASVDVVFEVKAEAIGIAEVTAILDADQVDTDPSDNSGTVGIEVIAVSTDDGGGFCSYHADGRFDPLMPALVLLSLVYLAYRNWQRKSDS